MPVVSVLVPVRNGEAYIGELCRSLLAQTFTGFEVVVLDDASTDGTSEALGPYRSDPRFRFLSFGAHRGLGFGMATLLRSVRGEYWCSPGADDVLEPEFLEQRVAQLEGHPEAGFAHGRPAFINEDGAAIPDPWGQPPLPPAMDGADALALLLHHNVVIQPSTLVRTSFTRLVQPLFLADWAYAPDWFLWLLHAAAGGAVLYDDRPLVRYRLHARSLTRTPEMQGRRALEVGLVPLCASSVAAHLSRAATLSWRQWRDALYVFWLRRAAPHRAHPAFADSVALAAARYYGTNAEAVSGDGELARFRDAMAAQAAQETAVLRGHRFHGTGLVIVNHPFFRRP